MPRSRRGFSRFWRFKLGALVSVNAPRVTLKTCGPKALKGGLLRQFMPVGQRFSDMKTLGFLRTGKIGDGAPDAQRPDLAAYGELQFFRCPFQKFARLGGRWHQIRTGLGV